MSAATKHQARTTATDGQAHALGADAAELAALRSELRTLFARLCAMAASGTAVLASAMDSPEADEKADLIAAAESMFGVVGHVGELGARACGDPGSRKNPAEWLALGDGLAGLQRLHAMSERARTHAASAAVAAGSASTGGAA